MSTVHLDGEKFEELLRCLSILKDNCNDIDIREGIIRQRTNDNTTIFEIDMTPLLADLSIPLTTIKQKLDLFKMFTGQEVTIEVDDTSFKFTDQYSSVKFISPNLDFLDNKFIAQEDFENIFDTDEEDLILNCEISERISERMRIVAQVFNINTVCVTFDGNSAEISAGTQAKDQSANFLSGIVADREMQASSYLVIIPFIIDHDETINFKMYNCTDGESASNMSVNFFTSAISDIDIRVYSRSTLAEIENDEEE